MTTENKLLLYQTFLKPIWTYGIKLWGTASNSNIEILQRFQNKVLRVIVNAPWYIPNNVLHKDLKTPTIRVETTRLCANYQDKLETHPNELIPSLLDEAEEPRRLKRFQPSDLSTRFSYTYPFLSAVRLTTNLEHIHWAMTPHVTTRAEC